MGGRAAPAIFALFSSLALCSCGNPAASVAPDEPGHASTHSSGIHGHDGLLYSDIGTIENSEFFKFFGLSNHPSIMKANGETSIIYSSTGKFNGTVMLYVYVDNEKDKNIKNMHITVNRSFIDRPETGMFARDFTKSFLSSALGSEDAAAAKSLIDEIWNSTPNGAVRYEHHEGQEGFSPTEGSQENPGSHSRAFQVFVGTAESAELPLTHSVVRLINRQTPLGYAVFMAKVEPRSE